MCVMVLCVCVVVMCVYDLSTGQVYVRNANIRLPIKHWKVIGNFFKRKIVRTKK